MNPDVYSRFYTGVVRSFNHKRGFGQIRMSEQHSEVRDKDVFVHAREVTDRQLQEGDRVRFRIGIAKKKKRDGEFQFEANQVEGGTVPKDEHDGRRVRGEICEWKSAENGGCGRVKEESGRTVFMHASRTMGALSRAAGEGADLVGKKIWFTTRERGAYYADFDLAEVAETSGAGGGGSDIDRRSIEEIDRRMTKIELTLQVQTDAIHSIYDRMDRLEKLMERVVGLMDHAVHKYSTGVHTAYVVLLAILAFCWFATSRTFAGVLCWIGGLLGGN
jgi:cold shock CspA family protein